MIIMSTIINYKRIIQLSSLVLQKLLFPCQAHQPSCALKAVFREVLEPEHLKFWESQGLQSGTSIRAGLFEKTDSWAHIYTGSLFSAPSKLELEVKYFQYMCISIGRAQTSTLKDFYPRVSPIWNVVHCQCLLS